MKIEYLEFILNRYDHYIDSTQNKSNLYIALHSLILTAIVSLYTNFNTEFNCILTMVALLIIVLSAISILYILIAVNAYTGTKLTNDSIIFFESVAKYREEGAYNKKINGFSDELFLEDLANQVNELAFILSDKYSKLRCTNKLLIFEFILIIIWIILFITL